MRSAGPSACRYHGKSLSRTDRSACGHSGMASIVNSHSPFSYSCLITTSISAFSPQKRHIPEILLHVDILTVKYVIRDRSFRELVCVSDGRQSRSEPTATEGKQRSPEIIIRTPNCGMKVGNCVIVKEDVVIRISCQQAVVRVTSKPERRPEKASTALLICG